MKQPKKRKYRKQFRGTWRRIATKGNKVSFGSYGIKSLDRGWITDRQIEAARVVLARSTRKTGKYWIRIYPDQPYTKKPPEVGMGGGKGEPVYYVASVAPGRMLFEIDGLPKEESCGILKRVSAKLPVKTKIAER